MIFLCNDDIAIEFLNIERTTSLFVKLHVCLCVQNLCCVLNYVFVPTKK